MTDPDRLGSDVRGWADGRIERSHTVDAFTVGTANILEFIRDVLAGPLVSLLVFGDLWLVFINRRLRIAAVAIAIRQASRPSLSRSL